MLMQISEADRDYPLKDWRPGEPRLQRSVTLQFIGDWGQANFHRICAWLTQEFCDRAGPRSRVATWNTIEGGIDAAQEVFDGNVDLAILTPAMALPAALNGTSIFAGRPMPNLRALAVLPQRDRMVLALPGDLGISSYAELRQRRPALKIATSEDNGFNLIGYIARHAVRYSGFSSRVAHWGVIVVYVLFGTMLLVKDVWTNPLGRQEDPLFNYEYRTILE